MKKILLTAMGSGQGKTVVCCALLAALKKRGMEVRAFKVGPDYIDPMFHSRVLGVPSRNLDLFLQGEESVRRSLRQHGGEIAVLEGAMGYYDGLNGTEEASAWDLARRTETPAVLILRPKGSALTLAAQIRGLQSFREKSMLTALLLNDCSESTYTYLKPLLEREAGLPVLGWLPHREEAELPSRHLGLLTAEEISDLRERFQALALQLEQTVELDALLALAAEDEGEESSALPERRCRIAVARDAAFCFCYADTLESLERAGAELVYFSPLTDSALPARVAGLYLPGGYPELHARELSNNIKMRESIAAAVRRGLPTVAECGGFLYLQQSLEDEDGHGWPMCGVLPGEGYRTPRLQRFGYSFLEAEENSMLFRVGERVPIHEFHHWDCTENGTDLLSRKPDGRSWPCCVATDSLYAGFPHLPFGGNTGLAERFVSTCIKHATILRKLKYGLQNYVNKVTFTILRK